MIKLQTLTLLFFLPLCPTLRGEDRADILLADFEGKDYGDWKVEGEAFGASPAHGALPGQQPVGGYLGKGLVNTFSRGDGPQGTLTSPELEITRRYINFLIGGGYHPGETSIHLIVDGKVARSATGADAEELVWHAWDVGDLSARKARIEIVDRHTGGWGHINIDQIELSDRARAVLYAHDGITRAMASVRRGTEGAARDPTRPIFHVAPPAGWNNDPNGPIFHGSFYHLFYQHNPYGDSWGNMHWGHVRSQDLVHWEHLPIALWPSKEEGEDHCFSGCATVDGSGQPIIFYTSIGPKRRAEDSAEQWAALGGADLLTWKKHPANPVLTEALHGNLKIYDWRDPFFFRHQGQAYLVLGGNLNERKGGEAVVSLYRAENSELTRWKHLGILFRHPDRDAVNIECPNFFELGEKWVLIVSPHRRVEYFVGTFNPEEPRFQAERRGLLDLGGDFYAPNCMKSQGGERILWGWIHGFKGGRGWNGCLTLPRILALGPDGDLRQAPYTGLKKLRMEPITIPDLSLDGSRTLAGVEGDALEMTVTLEQGQAREARALGLQLLASEDEKSGVRIAYDGESLEVGGERQPFKLSASERSLELHVFLDRSVVEVYANHRASFTRVVYPERPGRVVRAFSEGGKARVVGFRAWNLKSIW